MKTEETEYTAEEETLLRMLRREKVGATEALVFIHRVLKSAHGSLRRAEKSMELGEAERKRMQKTVSFEKAAEEAQKERAERRLRTQRDLRYILHGFMKRVPGLRRRRVRSIRSEECSRWIKQAFSTPSQQKKARAALSALFSTAQRRGWCGENPVRIVPAPRVQERTIRIFTLQDVSRLVRTAERYAGGRCLAAVLIMVYAGVRPQEVARLSWEHVHLEEGVICIPPQHSKTGGARQVTIHRPLAVGLRRARRMRFGQCRDIAACNGEKICPANWARHWTRLHREAGWRNEEGCAWQPDVLRHTFASHYLAAFRSYTELQVEMGHRSAHLLRTRYVSLAQPICGMKNIFISGPYTQCLRYPGAEEEHPRPIQNPVHSLSQRLKKGLHAGDMNGMLRGA